MITRRSAFAIAARSVALPVLGISGPAAQPTGRSSHSGPEHDLKIETFVCH